MIKKIVIVFVIFAMTFITSAYKNPDVYKIDAEKNAYQHNNKGLIDVFEHNYYAAIQEFCIAIALNPKTQATSVYYNNLGETYMKIGNYREAQSCFEMAIKQYNLNFLYYQNLVKSFECQKILKSKIAFYTSKGNKNSLNMVMLGLLYVASGDKRSGIIKLDEFCISEPDLLITSAVKNYIREITPDN